MRKIYLLSYNDYIVTVATYVCSFSRNRVTHRLVLIDNFELSSLNAQIKSILSKLLISYVYHTYNTFLYTIIPNLPIILVILLATIHLYAFT